MVLKLLRMQAKKLNSEITLSVEMSQKPITRELVSRKDGALNEERLVQEDVRAHENQVKSLCSQCRNYAPRQLAKPRRRWTKELHLWFLIAIENLGGPFVATPKRIKHLMGVSDLTYNEIQSHLQQHRMHIRRA